MGGEQRPSDIWLVTDRSETVETFSPLIEASGRLGLEVFRLPAIAEAYFALAGDPDVGGVILDLPVTRERTDENGAIAAAMTLREARPQLSIMLLTSAAERESGETEEVFDLVVDRDVACAHWPVYEARLLRDMGRWKQAEDERGRRMHELIDRTLAGDATPAEQQELASLRADVERPFAPLALAAEARWAAELDTQEARLARLEEISTRLDRALSGETTARVRRPA
jgi:hypothetical protein